MFDRCPWLRMLLIALLLAATWPARRVMRPWIRRREEQAAEALLHRVERLIEDDMEVVVAGWARGCEPMLMASGYAWLELRVSIGRRAFTSRCFGTQATPDDVLVGRDTLRARARQMMLSRSRRGSADSGVMIGLHIGGAAVSVFLATGSYSLMFATAFGLLAIVLAVLESK